MILRKKPLTCDEVRELLFEYSENSLDEWEAARVKAHLDGCEACRRELESVKALLSTMPLCAAEPPAALFDSVMAKIGDVSQEPKTSRSKKRFIPYGTVAAACAAVMIVVAGQQVIPMTDKVGVNDNGIAAVEVEKDGSDVVTTSSPEIKNEDTASEDKPEKAHITIESAFKVSDGDTDGIQIEVTSSQLVVGTPRMDETVHYSADTASAGEPADADRDIKNSGAVRTFFESVRLTAADEAHPVFVCGKSDFLFDISDYYVESVVYRNIEAERYELSLDSIGIFSALGAETPMELFDLLDKLIADNCSGIPSGMSSFGSFAIYLVSGE